MKFFLVTGVHWSTPGVVQSLHAAKPAADRAATALVVLLEQDALAEGLLQAPTDRTHSWAQRLAAIASDVSALCQAAPAVMVTPLDLDTDPGDADPIAALIAAVEDLVDHEGEAFDQDEPISGGDLVDWWVQSRARLKVLLGRPAPSDGVDP